MKEFKGALAMILSVVLIFTLALGTYAAPEVDTTDPEFLYKLYITDFLQADIGTTGKTQAELLDIKASELGISDSRAFELELECGLHPVIYTKDERPLPETTVATEPTENTQEIETTTIVLNTEGTTAEVTDTTEVKTTANTDPTETTSATSEESTPTEAVTEPSEILTEPVETTTEATDNISEPATEATSESTPSTTDEEKTTYRYYFYKPAYWKANEHSDTVGIYWWEGSSAPGYWPGYEAHKADAEGVYYYDVPSNVSVIIWNNFVDGGTDPDAEIYKLAYQTTNIGSEYYAAGECAAYPNGTKNFDGMIFVVASDVTSVNELSAKYADEGMWYYYYGNGEYGITPEKGKNFYTTSFLKEYPVTDVFDESIIPVYGDVNSDGKLNIKDATTIQKYVAKLWLFSNVEIYLADINEDGVVNVKDATHIQKKIANLL